MEDRNERERGLGELTVPYTADEEAEPRSKSVEEASHPPPSHDE